VHRGGESAIGIPYFIHEWFRSYYLRGNLKQFGVAMPAEAVPRLANNRLSVTVAASETETLVWTHASRLRAAPAIAS
jgi:hypothetical protein